MARIGDPPVKAAHRMPGRPKTVPDEVQKEAVARAAWSLLLENGYDGMGMAELARRAHMSLHTIYRLFPGKIEIAAAAAALHRFSIVALPGDYEDLPIADALARIFHVDMDAEALRHRYALLGMFVIEGERHPELGKVFSKNGPEEAFALLVEWLEQQQKAGRIRMSGSRVVAKMLMDLVYGAETARDWPRGPGAAPGDRAAYLRDCFAILIEGLRA